MPSPLPSTLPCFPCPHDAVCCSWGTRLRPDEAAAIGERYGAAAVAWSDEEEHWRTTIVNGHCFFWAHGCAIHETALYPSICRGFPWRHGDSEEEYPFELAICPELADR